MTKDQKIELLNRVQNGANIKELLNKVDVGFLIVKIAQGLYWCPQIGKRLTRAELEELTSPEEIEEKTKISFAG